ncbi:putative sexual differentiation process protein isp4 protein [Neofusicoccum parvum UCRNP2]|uniref:Putative sexual differentiation process protein isp4 protein n=1 Tax=Botryosphaeria parva (strain UCR-NP2) TaxID=1287680 RepID=R1EES7_BOTPV|nr:putative sexual differentiation process protein isp4 protein [Neofusicoccum parvum UCRNP2]
MSKTPLLLRSSPAQGTGSYGALPVHILSTSNESSADESTHDLDHVMRTGKRKAKSNLRDADTITEEEAESSKAPRNRTASDGRLLDDKGTKRSRRKSLPAVNLPDDHPSAVEAWVGSLEGEMESGLEGRFNSKAGMPSAAPVTEDTPSDSFQSDSSEAIDIDGSEDGGSEVGGQVRDKAAEESPPDDSPYPQLLKRLDDPAEVFTNGSIHHRAADAVEYGSSNGAINLQDHDGDGSMAHGEKKRSWTRSLRLWLAQGKWNEKEHCCVYISSNVSFGFAFATDVIVEQSMFYHQKLTITYQILLTISTQILGVITWFAPKNVVVANLFGVASGLGLFPMTFDWSQIAYIGSPLVVPFWAALNIVGGLVVVMWIMAPIMYYLNIMYSSYMPILSAAVFDNTGKPYDVSKILTTDFLFDEKAYESYSRVFLPITYVLSYALQFAALTALLSHTACWHGKDILRQWKASWKEIKGQSEQPGYQQIPQEQQPLRHKKSTRSMTASMPDLDNMMAAEDVHNRLMRRYKDAPMTWYLLTGVVMTAIGMFVVE